VRVAKKIRVSSRDLEYLREIIESLVLPTPVKRRARAVLLAYGDGHDRPKNKAIAAELGVSRQAVGDWLRIYADSELGLEVLLKKPVPGAGRQRTWVPDPGTLKQRTWERMYPILTRANGDQEEHPKWHVRASIKAIDHRLRRIAMQKKALTKYARRLRARRRELASQLVRRRS